MKRAGEDLDDVERMRGERGDGAGGGGRAPMQRRRNEGSRWWHHEGSFVLYGLVKYHEQTRIGRVAQRRSQESTKEFRRPAVRYGPQGRDQGAVRMEVTLQGGKERRGVIRSRMIQNGGETFADLVSGFEYGEWIQHEADGNASRGTCQEVPGIRQ